MQRLAFVTGGNGGIGSGRSDAIVKDKYLRYYTRITKMNRIQSNFTEVSRFQGFPL